MNPTAIFLLLLAAGLLVLASRSSGTAGRANARTMRKRVDSIARTVAGGVQVLPTMRDRPTRLAHFIHDSGAFVRLQHLITKAGSRHPPKYYMTMSGAIALGGILVLPLAGLRGVAALLMAAGLATIPFVVLKVQADRRRAKFEDQLPEVLDFLARSLRAGHGLNAAFQMVGDEVAAPAGDEFRRVFDEINFGFSFQVALRRLADRIDSSDLSFFVTGLLIQRETGGNLSELMGNLASLGRERMKLKGKVKVLAAEGKLSGVMLGVLPFLIGGMMTALNAEYMSILWTTESGINLIGSGLFMLLLGFVWMNKLAQIKV